MATPKVGGGVDPGIAGFYNFVRTIGKGHFATVKQARHVCTGERVAVKIIDKSKLDVAAESHLFQEVRCMKLVQHVNVVRLFEVIDTARKLYLVLELGTEDLYESIITHASKMADMGHTPPTSLLGFSEPTARILFSQIASAVAYCHNLHVVHRDLKPENCIVFGPLAPHTSGSVTIASNPHAYLVKITDFGFSQLFDPGRHLETACGSLAYSAPEILLGNLYDAPTVDTWSAGVILFMLVTGDLPFKEANDSETLVKILDCVFTIPKLVSPDCSALIRSLLVKDASKRLTSPGILAHPWLSPSSISNPALASNFSASGQSSSVGLLHNHPVAIGKPRYASVVKKFGNALPLGLEPVSEKGDHVGDHSFSVSGPEDTNLTEDDIEDEYESDDPEHLCCLEDIHLSLREKEAIVCKMLRDEMATPEDIRRFLTSPDDSYDHVAATYNLLAESVLLSKRAAARTTRQGLLPSLLKQRASNGRIRTPSSSSEHLVLGTSPGSNLPLQSPPPTPSHLSVGSNDIPQQGLPPPPPPVSAATQQQQPHTFMVFDAIKEEDASPDETSEVIDSLIAFRVVGHQQDDMVVMPPLPPSRTPSAGPTSFVPFGSRAVSNSHSTATASPPLIRSHDLGSAASPIFRDRTLSASSHRRLHALALATAGPAKQKSVSSGTTPEWAPFNNGIPTLSSVSGSSTTSPFPFGDSDLMRSVMPSTQRNSSLDACTFHHQSSLPGMSLASRNSLSTRSTSSSSRRRSYQFGSATGIPTGGPPSGMVSGASWRRSLRKPSTGTCSTISSTQPTSGVSRSARCSLATLRLTPSAATSTPFLTGVPSSSMLCGGLLSGCSGPPFHSTGCPLGSGRSSCSSGSRSGFTARPPYRSVPGVVNDSNGGHATNASQHQQFLYLVKQKLERQLMEQNVFGRSASGTIHPSPPNHLHHTHTIPECGPPADPHSANNLTNNVSSQPSPLLPTFLPRPRLSSKCNIALNPKLTSGSCPSSRCSRYSVTGYIAGLQQVSKRFNNGQTPTVVPGSNLDRIIPRRQRSASSFNPGRMSSAGQPPRPSRGHSLTGSLHSGHSSGRKRGGSVGSSSTDDDLLSPPCSGTSDDDTPNVLSSHDRSLIMVVKPKCRKAKRKLNKCIHPNNIQITPVAPSTTPIQRRSSQPSNVETTTTTTSLWPATSPTANDATGLHSKDTNSSTVTPVFSSPDPSDIAVASSPVVGSKTSGKDHRSFWTRFPCGSGRMAPENRPSSYAREGAVVANSEVPSARPPPAKTKSKQRKPSRRPSNHNATSSPPNGHNKKTCAVM